MTLKTLSSDHNVVSAWRNPVLFLSAHISNVHTEYMGSYWYHFLCRKTPLTEVCMEEEKLSNGTLPF